MQRCSGSPGCGRAGRECCPGKRSSHCVRVSDMMAGHWTCATPTGDLPRMPGRLRADRCDLVFLDALEIETAAVLAAEARAGIRVRLNRRSSAGSPTGPSDTRTLCNVSSRPATTTVSRVREIRTHGLKRVLAGTQ